MSYSDSTIKEFSHENWKILKNIKKEKKCLENFQDSICIDTRNNSTVGEEQTGSVSELSKDPLIYKWLTECDQYNIESKPYLELKENIEKDGDGTYPENNNVPKLQPRHKNDQYPDSIVNQKEGVVSNQENVERSMKQSVKDDVSYRTRSFDEDFSAILLCAFSIEAFSRFFLEINWSKVKGTHTLIEICRRMAQLNQIEETSHQLQSSLEECCDILIQHISNVYSDNQHATMSCFLKIMRTCLITYFRDNKKAPRCLKNCKQKIGSHHTVIDHVFCGKSRIRIECLSCGGSTFKKGTVTPRMLNENDALKFKALIVNFVDYEGHFKAVDKTRLLFLVKETTRLQNLTERLAIELRGKSRKIRSRDLVANKITADCSIMRLGKDDSLFSVIGREGELYYHHVVDDSEASLGSRSPTTSTPLQYGTSDTTDNASAAASVTRIKRFPDQRLVVAIKVTKRTFDGPACLRLFFVRIVRRIMASELYEYFEQTIKPTERGLINIYIRRPKVANCRLCANQDCPGCPLNPNRIVMLSEDDQIEVNYAMTDNSVLLGFSETVHDHYSFVENNPLVLRCVEDYLNPLSNCVSTLSCQTCRMNSQCFVERTVTHLPELLWLDLSIDHKPVIYPESGLIMGSSVLDMRGCVIVGKDNRLIAAVKRKRKGGWRTINKNGSTQAVSLSNGHFKMRLMVYKRREKEASHSIDNMMNIPIVCKREGNRTLNQQDNESSKNMKSLVPTKTISKDASTWSIVNHKTDGEYLNKKFCRAVQKCRIKSACDLLQKGASPNATEDGLGVIHLAAGMEEPMGGLFLQLLLDNGADLHLLTGNGMSALHVAALWDRKKTAELLIKRGALVEMQDGNGLQAIDMVEDHEQCQMVGSGLCYFCKAVQDTHGRTLSVLSRDLDASIGLVDFNSGDYKIDVEESYPKKVNGNEAARKWSMWRVWSFVTKIIRPWQTNANLHER